MERTHPGADGKLLSLAYLLRTCPAAVEADLQRYYQLDLLDVFRGRLGACRVARLISQLPPDCACSRATSGQGYTAADHLLTLVADLLAVANWQRQNAGLPKNKQSKPPKPLPRPGAADQTNKISSAQLRKQLERLQARKAKEVNDG